MSSLVSLLALASRSRCDILPSVCSHMAASGFTRSRFPPDPIVLIVFPLKSLMVISSQFCRREESLPLGDSKQPDSDIMAGKFSFRVSKATTRHPGDSDFLGITDSLIMKVDGVYDR